MNRHSIFSLLVTVSAVALSSHTSAQTVETAQEIAREQHRDRSAEGFTPSHAVGADIFYSTDADDTEVLKLGANLDWKWKGPDEYLGLRVETAKFSPIGQSSREAQRVYLRGADTTGDWTWKFNAGTDGDALLGSASVNNNARFRQEYFIEREVLETPQGVDDGIYYTFIGGALDLPINDRNNVTLVAGLQDFTGENVRTHLRATYVHVLKPEWGVSVQLRARYFHSSHPGEFDYFSPEDYVEVMPVVQMRRYYGGWRYLVAGGYGGQKASGDDWNEARFVTAQVVSPPVREWAVNAGVTYSNTPIASGYTYDYTQFNVGLTRAF
ncbi:hypothetical protein [Brevundimonas pishanensis]|uniref:hypothetical protein n=1 Tax=Brevundimonas pishanensis TaxID=2896315 RepID=UPI001FA8021A|nr:hypothetical protein [Brevundimonas pishanensis]